MEASRIRRALRGLTLAAVLSVPCHAAFAQTALIDGVIGMKRARVQSILRPYRLLDYQHTLATYRIDKGVEQTVIFERDTCTSFIYRVDSTHVDRFIATLEEGGYRTKNDTVMTHDGLRLIIRPGADKGRTLFLAWQEFPRAAPPRPLPQAQQQAAQYRPQPTRPSPRSNERSELPYIMPLPLMQQAAMLMKNDTVKPPRDPSRHWVGSEQTETRVLGWPMND